jgi:protein CMS1
MKLEEQVKFLQSHRTVIGVGTPGRLSDLIEDGKLCDCAAYDVIFLTMRIGALSGESLVRIVVDASHVDQKRRGILDMKDTMMPLAKLLARKEFKERYSSEDRPLVLLFY